MLKTLITILKLNRDYTTNLLLYYLKHTPIINKIYGYNSSNKKLKESTKFYFVVFKLLLPFILIYSLFAFFIEPALKNLYISPKELTTYFISSYFSLFAFLGFINSNIFKTSTYKTYALRFLKININDFMRTNYLYLLVKSFLSHLITLYFCHHIYSLNWYHVVLLPLFIIFINILSTTIELFIYSKTKKVLSHSIYYKTILFSLGVGITRLLSLINYLFTFKTFVVLLPFYIILSFIGLKYILTFNYYILDKKLFYSTDILESFIPSNTDVRSDIKSAFEIIQTNTLTHSVNTNIEQKNKQNINSQIREENNNIIMDETFTDDSFIDILAIKSKENSKQTKINKEIKESGSPFKYITNIFFKRYRNLIFPNILMTSYSIIMIAVISSVLALFIPNIKESLKNFILNSIPILPLIVYLCNSTKSITKSLFFNCDAPLLTYKFYRNKKTNFSIFIERFKKCILYNTPTTLLLIVFIVAISLILNINEPFFLFYIITSMVLLLLIFTTLGLFIYYIFQPYDYSTKGTHPLYSIFNVILIVLGLGISDFNIDAHMLFNWVALISIWFIPISITFIYYFGYKTLKHKNL